MWGCSCGQLAGPGIDWIKRPEPKLIPTQNQASSYLESLQMLQTAALGADLGESGYCTAIPTNCCVPGGRHGGYCQTLVKKIKKKSQPLGDISDPSALKLGCASSGGKPSPWLCALPTGTSLLQRCSEDVMCMGLAVWEPVHILLVSLQATFLNASEQ